MTWVRIRESTFGAALTLISKDDLIDDDEPTVGDTDSTHRHLLREALIPVNDDQFWDGFYATCEFRWSSTRIQSRKFNT